jgi:hypothetical protein
MYNFSPKALGLGKSKSLTFENLLVYSIECEGKKGIQNVLFNVSTTVHTRPRLI